MNRAQVVHPAKAAVARRAGLPHLPDDGENCPYLTLTVSKSVHNFCLIRKAKGRN
jgi:hypothetical protein